MPIMLKQLSLDVPFLKLHKSGNGRNMQSRLFIEFVDQTPDVCLLTFSRLLTENMRMAVSAWGNLFIPEELTNEVSGKGGFQKSKGIEYLELESADVTLPSLGRWEAESLIFFISYNDISSAIGKCDFAEKVFHYEPASFELRYLEYLHLFALMVFYYPEHGSFDLYGESEEILRVVKPILEMNII
jgi:hypothetical protein